MRIWLYFVAYVCIAGMTLYRYIDKLNELTELKLVIPSLAKEVIELKDRNQELLYQIESFKNPAHLMQLAKQPEFAHLQPIKKDDVVLIYDYD